MWSNVTIPGKPSILIVDASCNREGWEREFTDRVFGSFLRSGLSLVTAAPVHVAEPQELESYLALDFNCILFFSHGEGEGISAGARMQTHWNWLNSRTPRLRPALFACILLGDYDPEVSRQILKATDTFAPLALAPQSVLTPREAGLFLLKFFTELHLHSEENISGKMVWFSGSKARELLRKRRYTGKFGIRA